MWRSSYGRDAGLTSAERALAENLYEHLVWEATRHEVERRLGIPVHWQMNTDWFQTICKVLPWEDSAALADPPFLLGFEVTVDEQYGVPSLELL